MQIRSIGKKQSIFSNDVPMKTIVSFFRPAWILQKSVGSVWLGDSTRISRGYVVTNVHMDRMMKQNFAFENSWKISGRVFHAFLPACWGGVGEAGHRPGEQLSTKPRSPATTSSIRPNWPPFFLHIPLRGFLEGSSLVAQSVKNPPAMQETRVWSHGLEDPLEKGMATTPVFLPEKIPRTEGPGGLQSTGSQELDTTLQRNHQHHAFKTLPSTAGGTGSISGQGAKNSHTLWPKNQNTKQKQHCNKFNRDFKNWST